MSRLVAHRMFSARHALRRAVWVIAVAIFESLGAGRAEGAPRSPDPKIESLSYPLRDLLWTQVPRDAAAHSDASALTIDFENPLPRGARIVTGAATGGAGEPVALTPGFAAAGRPDVSFDGLRILFVGRRGALDRDQVWEMNRDGTGVRCVTTSAMRVASQSGPIYLPTLYTMDAEAPMHQIAFTGVSTGGGASFAALYTCRLDGAALRPITFTPDGAWGPMVLSDGRILFATRAAGDAPGGSKTGGAGVALMSVNTDGTDVFPFFGFHTPRLDRAGGAESADGNVYFVESSLLGGGSISRIASVRRSRSLHSHRIITDDSGGRYRTPRPLPDGRLLVAYRRPADATYGLALSSATTGAAASMLYDSPDYDDVDPVVLAARREPDARSSVVDDRVATGWVYALDARLTDRPRPEGAAIGIAGAVRVYRRGDGERLLGEVPLETDGSFYLEVPARVPLRFETVDSNGGVVQSMRSWMWVMPKEARGCIGCHEDRQLSPTNRFVAALRNPPHRLGIAEETNEREPSVGPAYARPGE